MADKKKTNLLEESAVRHFMKIAGTGKLANTFVKKVLKEEDSGRGKIFNPHGDDARHDNLNEEEVTEEGKDLEESDVKEEGQEVAEEGKDLEEEVQEEGEVQEEAVGSIVSKGPGKAIESGKGMSGTGKKPTKKVQYEAKGALTPKGPGKAIESGKGLNGTGKKPTKKVQYEEVQEEGDQLQEFGGPPGGEEELGSDPAMGGSELPEPPMGGAGEGGLDLQALLGAIAQAITQQTGVQVSVEGGEGEMGGEPEADLGADPSLGGGGEGGEEAPPEEEPPMQETGIVGYKTEDPKARKMTSGQMQEGKKPQGKVSAKAPANKTPAKKLDDKQQLVETIANKVLEKLNQAAKVKQPAKKK
jgi:hypothetical protein